MKILRHLSALLLLAMMSAPAFAAPSAQEVALEFVTRHRVGGNLPSMALLTATQTQTYAMLASKLGVDEAKASVSKELHALLPRFQATWNQNLAHAYAANFSAEELASLAAEGRGSRYAAKLAEKQGAVGDAMRSASEPVLKTYVSEALKNAVDKAPR